MVKFINVCHCEIARSTGGAVWYPNDVNSVGRIALQLARDIRSQYTIGYHSTKPISVPGFRKVDVTAESKGEGKLTVRTRTGYFPSLRPVGHAAGAGK